MKETMGHIFFRKTALFTVSGRYQIGFASDAEDGMYVKAKETTATVGYGTFTSVDVIMVTIAGTLTTTTMLPFAHSGCGHT